MPRLFEVPPPSKKTFEVRNTEYPINFTHKVVNYSDNLMSGFHLIKKN